MKKTPKTLSNELKFHNMADGILALYDYNNGTDARTVVSRLRRSKSRKTKPGWHHGDPCWWCGGAHDDVGLGDCPGNPS